MFSFFLELGNLFGYRRGIVALGVALALPGAKSSLVRTFLVFWSEVFEGVSTGC
jgi:hypothetical protein